MKSLILFVGLSLLPAAAVAQSDAQKSFDKLKTLAGTWQGAVTTDPKQPDADNKPLLVTLRVTSRGNTMVHEMREPGPDDPNRTDHPVTMLYLDSDRLLLTHYCDAGNRPRMVGKISPDGKKVEFEFLDLSGGNQYGHMYHAVFTMVDADHHIEDWTYGARRQARPRAHGSRADQMTEGSSEGPSGNLDGPRVE